MDNPDQFIDALTRPVAMSKAGKISEQESKVINNYLIEKVKSFKPRINRSQDQSVDYGFYQNDNPNQYSSKKQMQKVDSSSNDLTTQELKQHYQVEGQLDFQKFRMEHNQKQIKIFLKNQSKANLNGSLNANSSSLNVLDHENMGDMKHHMHRGPKHHNKNISFNVITREQREKILSGIKYKQVPPVGVYSPRYEAVLQKQQSCVKFNQQAGRASIQNQNDSNSSIIRGASESNELPSIRLKQSLIEKIPEKLHTHIPNISFAKQSIRKNEALLINLADDSNIEYKNIFPEILGKNRRTSCNVSIDKMTYRSKLYKDLANAPSYNLNFSQVEEKVRVPKMSGKFAANRFLTPSKDQVSNTFSNRKSSNDLVPNNEEYSTRQKLKQINNDIVERLDNGRRKMTQEIVEESADDEKVYILKTLKVKQ